MGFKSPVAHLTESPGEGSQEVDPSSDSVRAIGSKVPKGQASRKPEKSSRQAHFL